MFWSSFLSVPDEYINVAHHFRISWIAKKAHSLKSGSRVLDVGAGECPYKAFFGHCQYFTHDFKKYTGTSRGPLKDKFKYGKIDYISDITKIPVATSSFDAVLCTEVLEHVPNPAGALSEMSRILKKGGRLFLTAPLASGLHQEPYHYYGGFTPYFYRKFLPEMGFKIVEVVPFGGLMKHLAQEIHRAGRILLEKFPKRPSFLAKYIFAGLLPRYFGSLDREIFVKEFTVGYAVEAKKHSRL